VSSIRVSADSKDVGLTSMSDVQVAQLLPMIVICRGLSTEQRRCGGYNIVDDVDELWYG